MVLPVGEKSRQIALQERLSSQSCANAELRLCKQDGWYEIAHIGSHKRFKHPVRRGRVTMPHPVRDISIATLRSIEKQAGIRLGRLMDYIAYLHKDRKSDFGVSFPDWPDIFHRVSRHGSHKGPKSGTLIRIIIVARKNPTRDAVLCC
jgi:predicted RNA binding protein YcfA (HicA-like mRNA interferase family)